MGTWIDYKTIKTRVGIEKILERYGALEKLKRKGDSLIGCCPIHHGTNATGFNVSLTKNIWRCFGDCSRGGNTIDLVCELEGLNREKEQDFRKAAAMMQEWFGLECERPQGGRRKAEATAPAPTVAETQGATYQPAAQEISAASERIPDVKVNIPLKFALRSLDPDHPYLAGRGLDRETVDAFGVGYFKNPKGLMAGRIAIPIHNEHGELVAYVGRWPAKDEHDTPPEGEGKYRLPGGFHKSLVVFNLHRARESAQEHGLIVVEGFFDCMKIWQAGYHNVVALMGSSMSDEQEQLIVGAAGPQGKATLMLDEDEAGRICRDGKVKDGAWEPGILQRLASRVYVKVIALGNEGMQPDKLSEETIRALLG